MSLGKFILSISEEVERWIPIITLFHMYMLQSWFTDMLSVYRRRRMGVNEEEWRMMKNTLARLFVLEVLHV